MNAAIDLRTAITALKAYIESRDFAGYDPYDALNSPLVSFFTFGNKFACIVAIQALKRMPINMRPILGIRPGRNPKGLGLFLSGYLNLYRYEKKPEYLQKIEYLIDLLEQCKTSTTSGHGWGYNFDWQSRAFFIPKFTPTVVNSAFIGHALIDAYLSTDNEQALRLSMPIADFILKDLKRLEENDAICFSYTPLDHYFVHNANLLGASLLIRLYPFNKNEEMKDAALKSLKYSMDRQLESGAWFYSEKESSHWIDSFHTGFNLQAVLYFLDAGFGEEYRARFEKGVRYYSDNFFLPDGTSKYFTDRVYPIDIHSAAQAIAFFSGMGESYRELTERILDWTLKNMFNKKGYFYFQKHRFYTNKIPYMRWSQAWIFHALTEYALNNK